MAFQFIHLEAYSRKADKGGRSTSFVFDEAERQPHACVHVENPEPPTVVHGCSISDLRMMHDQAVADVRTVNKDGKEKAIRIDQKTLLTVVASHPYTVAECKADAVKMAEYEAWERDTVQWLRDQYGDDLKTVVRHSDESHMHIHAYILPGHLKALEMHPGVSAKRKEKVAAIDRGEDAKTANKSGDAAYKESMRQWQDSYFDGVAQRHGLARLGPKLRRLSRSEWQREKVAAASLKNTVEKAAVLQLQGNQYIRDVKKKAAGFTAETKRLHSAAVEKEKAAVALFEQAHDSAKKNILLNEKAQKQVSEANKKLKNAHAEANRILRSAQSKAEKVTAFGSRIRSFFTGFRINKIRDKINEEVNREKAEEIGQLERAKKMAYDARDHERDLRRQSEIRANNAFANVCELSGELAKANARISELTPKPKRKLSVAGNEVENDFAVRSGMRM